MNPTTKCREKECALLRKLYAANNGGLTQAEFGLKYGIGTQGMVSQYLRGLRPLNAEAAAKFADGLGVEVVDFSPRLAGLELPAKKTRIAVGIKVRADLHGGMIVARGKSVAAGDAATLTDVYEAAIADYLAKHGIDLPD